MGKNITPAHARLLAVLLDVDEADLDERLDQVNADRDAAVAAAVDEGGS